MARAFPVHELVPAAEDLNPAATGSDLDPDLVDHKVSSVEFQVNRLFDCVSL